MSNIRKDANSSPRKARSHTLRYLLVGCGILLALLLIIRAIRTPAAADDRAQVLALILSAAQAAEKRDSKALTALLSPEYRDQRGHDRSTLKKQLALYFFRRGTLSVYVITKDVTLDSDAPNRASARLSVVLTRTPKVEHLNDLVPDSATALTFQLTLTKEEGTWLVREAAWQRAGLHQLIGKE